MLNKAILMGRLTHEPELRYTASGVSICAFSVAVDRNFISKGEKKSTDFINVVAWRQTAEFVAKYFTKGKLIAVEGRIQTRSWDDAQGAKRYTTEIVADSVYFADSKKAVGSDISSDEGCSQSSSSFLNLSNSIVDSEEFDESDFAVVDGDDDLPF